MGITGSRGSEGIQSTQARGSALANLCSAARPATTSLPNRLAEETSSISGGSCTSEALSVQTPQEPQKCQQQSLNADSTGCRGAFATDAWASEARPATHHLAKLLVNHQTPNPTPIPNSHSKHGEGRHSVSQKRGTITTAMHKLQRLLSRKPSPALQNGVQHQQQHKLPTLPSSPRLQQHFAATAASQSGHSNSSNASIQQEGPPIPPLITGILRTSSAAGVRPHTARRKFHDACTGNLVASEQLQPQPCLITSTGQASYTPSSLTSIINSSPHLERHDTQPMTPRTAFGHRVSFCDAYSTAGAASLGSGMPVLAGLQSSIGGDDHCGVNGCGSLHASPASQQQGAEHLRTPEEAEQPEGSMRDAAPSSPSMADGPTSRRRCASVKFIDVADGSVMAAGEASSMKLVPGSTGGSSATTESSNVTANVVAAPQRPPLRRQLTPLNLDGGQHMRRASYDESFLARWKDSMKRVFGRRAGDEGGMQCNNGNGVSCATEKVSRHNLTPHQFTRSMDSNMFSALRGRLEGGTDAVHRVLLPEGITPFDPQPSATHPDGPESWVMSHSTSANSSSAANTQQRSSPVPGLRTFVSSGRHLSWMTGSSSNRIAPAAAGASPYSSGTYGSFGSDSHRGASSAAAAVAAVAALTGAGSGHHAADSAAGASFGYREPSQTGGTAAGSTALHVWGPHINTGGGGGVTTSRRASMRRTGSSAQQWVGDGIDSAVAHTSAPPLGWHSSGGPSAHVLAGSFQTAPAGRMPDSLLNMDSAQEEEQCSHALYSSVGPGERLRQHHGNSATYRDASDRVSCGSNIGQQMAWINGTCGSVVHRTVSLAAAEEHRAVQLVSHSTGNTVGGSRESGGVWAEPHPRPILSALH